MCSINCYILENVATQCIHNAFGTITFSDKHRSLIKWPIILFVKLFHCVCSINLIEFNAKFQ